LLTLTYKHVAQVCQHQLSFLFYFISFRFIYLLRNNNQIAVMITNLTARLYTDSPHVTCSV